jgi:hypothetical protein
VGRKVDGKVEFRSFHEYDSVGSGRYYSDDLLMCDRYTFSEAAERADGLGDEIYYVEIHKTDGEYDREIHEPDSQEYVLDYLSKVNEAHDAKELLKENWK